MFLLIMFLKIAKKTEKMTKIVTACEGTNGGYMLAKTTGEHFFNGYYIVCRGNNGN